jgi:hypothetical protein
MRLVDVYWEKEPACSTGLGVKRGFSRTFEYTYIRSGRKYRATCRLISGTQTNLARLCESAFDGTSYVCYDADQRYMRRSSAYQPGERGECQNSPLIAPFMFLSRQSDDCPSCTLRFADLAAPSVTSGLTIAKAKRYGGRLEVAFPGLPLGKQPTVWTVSIEESGNAFSPTTIHRAIPGFGQEVTYKLLSYTNLGAYRFPARIEWAASASSPTSSPSIVATGMTRVLSMQIPQQVSDSTFQLDEKSAATIWDVDEHRFTKSERVPNRR